MPSTLQLLVSALLCGLSAACAARSDTRLVLPSGPGVTPQEQAAVQPVEAEPLTPQGQDGYRNYFLPVAEIVGMDAIFNLAGRRIYEPETFQVSTASIRRNLRGPWVVDEDPFQVNQFGHPYQGAMYHTIARSTGHGFWPSMMYTFAGSALWEIFGETSPPSRNDQIASGIAGSFLGEPLHRISRLLLDRADTRPGIWRKLGSILASPPTGMNQALVGRPRALPRSDAVPFSDIRVQIGGTGITADGTAAVSSVAWDQPRFALFMDHGHPGNPNYQHERPFDYFRIESSVSGEGLEHLSTRGLLAGDDYHAGRVDGMWGVYGTYDYFAPADFRFSSTAIVVGTTLQASVHPSLTVQGSGLIGGGYVAAHAVGRTDARDDDHYGVAPHALANLRLIAGRRAALDLTARDYLVTDVGGFSPGRRDLIFVGDAWLAVRVFGKNAIGLTYQLAGRSSEYVALPERTQSRTTVGVYYVFLGSGGFGTVR